LETLDDFYCTCYVEGVDEGGDGFLPTDEVEVSDERQVHFDGAVDVAVAPTLAK
jgi:hypothetical protein